MFRCEYCGSQFLEHKANCPNCGAQIQINQNPANAGVPSAASEKAIREICEKFEGDDDLYYADSINAKRLRAARTHFKIPANEKIWLVYDDTVFGSNKQGFAVCQSGLYWKNDWSVTTKRNFLSWQDFTARPISLENLEINLGRGDRIGVAGAVSDEIRANIYALLLELQMAY